MQKKILSFIQKKLNNKKISSKNLKKNYFQEGILDSFQLMLLISTLEKNYKIKFSNKEFEDKNFLTIYGISNIVAKKIK
jgi:acyl carrier protein|tara:strand:+ start:608 stop:844 length:237 start_codon:yes stop_codon:yes gene_type:complete